MTNGSIPHQMLHLPAKTEAQRAGHISRLERHTHNVRFEDWQPYYESLDPHFTITVQDAHVPRCPRLLIASEDVLINSGMLHGDTPRQLALRLIEAAENLVSHLDLPADLRFHLCEAAIGLAAAKPTPSATKS